METSVSVSPNFGTVEINGNFNVTITGTNNTGSVLYNTNLILQALSSVVYLNHNDYCEFYLGDNVTLKANKNVNTKINAGQSHLFVDSNTNTKIRGESNKLRFWKNNDVVFFGSDNTGFFISNNDINYSGNKGICNFLRNTNTKIFGLNNDITATNTTNLDVEGDNHRLIIAGVKDHVVKTVVEGSSENIVLIALDPADLNRVVYHVDYVKEAKIEGDEYMLGIFKFYITKEKQIRVVFDYSGLDKDSFQVTTSSTTKYTVTATKNGSSQSLSIVGPAITADTNSKDFILVNLKGATAFV